MSDGKQRETQTDHEIIFVEDTDIIEDDELRELFKKARRQSGSPTQTGLVTSLEKQRVWGN